MSQTPSIIWFRLDLRLHDNAALIEAIHHGGPVIPVFIWSPEEEPQSKAGAAAQWWLHHSLQSLDENLQKKQSRLIVRRGPLLETLQQLLKETGAHQIFWNRRYEPDLIERDKKMKSVLVESGKIVKTFNSALLFEPWQIQTQQGTPFRVFTPFWKNCLSQAPTEVPLPPPEKIPSPPEWPNTITLDELQLLPKIQWDTGLKKAWVPGEGSALKALEDFLKENIRHYDHQRDIPSIEGTSQFSPHLHFGEISPRTIFHQVRTLMVHHSDASFQKSANRFLAEIGWREFGYHLLYHFPQTPTEPLQLKFKNFPWENDKKLLTAWQKGLTGYPIVDAGMRQLWTTGWMHNRVRMIVASFLVKDLFINWNEGAQWFWDTLVDADLASNTLGWQWTAGCGADAAPFFRVFNPSLQGQKFDEKGGYVRQWVPELKNMPDKYIHSPWEASVELQKSVQCLLGRDYPHPIVDHSVQRDKALLTFKTLGDSSNI